MWKKVDCSVQGRSHVKDQIPCQDKTFCYKDHDILVAALADGAGSAKLSHYGAECVTEYVAKDFATYFDLYFNSSDGRTIKKQILSKIINKLDELSENLGCEKKDCASTLLAVAVKGDRFLLMHIGDGVIGYTKDNKIKIASYPDNGEFSNVTVFTTSPDAILSMKLLKGELNGIDSFILMSDGTEAGLYHKKNKSLTSALVRVVDFVRFFPELTVRDMLVDSLKNVIQQVTVDDCSIAIIANDYGKDVRYLPISEQRDLLAVGSKKYPAHKSKRMYRINYILSMLEQPIARDEIARCLHIKKKYVRKYTDFLESKGIIEQCGNKFIYLR